MKALRIDALLPLVGPVVLLCVWQLLTTVASGTAHFLPTPGATLWRAYALLSDGALVADILATIGRWLTGFLLAVFVGAPIGLLLGASTTLGQATSVVVDFFRSLPVTAVFPVFLVMFGVGSGAMVAMVFFATVFIVMVHAIYGVRSTPDARRMMAKSFGATTTQAFVHIRAIEAAGHVLIGARTALSLSLIVAIVSEMFIGANRGLGQRLYMSYQLQSLADMYAIILIIGIMGYFANYLFVRFERRFTQ